MEGQAPQSPSSRAESPTSARAESALRARSPSPCASSVVSAAKTVKSAAVTTGNAKASFSEKCLLWLHKTFDEVGGPLQYMEMRWSTTAHREEWIAAVQAHFYDPGVSYTLNVDKIPAISKNDLSKHLPVVVPLAAFGWGADRSVRGAPERGVAKKLAAELVKDGFVSSGEPVLIHLDKTSEVVTSSGVKPPWVGTLRPLSVGYLKGQARALTLLCAVAYYLDNWEDSEIKDGQQDFFIKAACSIYCHHVDTGPSQLDKLFYNFSLASRGSIRQAPHVLSWVVALTKLKENPTDCIRKWNSVASKAQQLAGTKALAVRQVLEKMPTAVLSFLLDHLGACGDYEQSALSDDVLSSKRIFPGFVFRNVNKDWTQRGRVTAESAEITARWVVGTFMRTPQRIRTRVTKATWEEASEVCACLCSFVAEIMNMVPIPVDTLDDALIKRFIGGDSTLELQVTCAIREKAPDFKVTDIPLVKEIIEGHSRTSPIVASSLTVSSQNLEKDSFELLIKQLRYDTEVFKVYKRRVLEVDHAAFYAKLQAKDSRRKNAVQAAEHFLAKKCSIRPVDRQARLGLPGR